MTKMMTKSKASAPLQDALFDLFPVMTTPAPFQALLDALGVGEYAPDHFARGLRSYFADYFTQTAPNKRPQVLSLFAGGGGLDIAFHDAGFEILETVEFEEKFAETLQKNANLGGWLGGTRVVCQDIRAYQPNHELKVDFIIGGPPCQTFSAAGRRAAGVQGTNDPKGMLFAEYVRLLKQLQPKGFLFENVAGLMGAQQGEAWSEIQTAFAGAGYKLFSRLLDAADYGVPQHRERLFIIGLKMDLQQMKDQMKDKSEYKSEYQFPRPTHGPDSSGAVPYYSAQKALEGVFFQDMTMGIGGRYGALLENIPPGLNYSFYTREMGYPYPVFSWRSKFSDFLYKADPETPVRTLKAQGGQYTGPFHWTGRKFSINELKRLQTFPDTYVLVGNQQVQIQQLGNSVPPQLGRILAISIMEQIFDIHLPVSLPRLADNEELGFRKRKRSLTEAYAGKARVALLRLEQEGKLHRFEYPEFEDGEHIRYLGTDFSWLEQGTSEPIPISLNHGGKFWNISADLKWATEEAYSLMVRPTQNDPWALDVDEIILWAGNFSPQNYIALWKSLEEQIKNITGIADLVQLSGYYQYSPKIKIEYRSKTNISQIHIVLSHIVRGDGVGVQVAVESFARVWQMSERQARAVLHELRDWGYEVRNHYTNPQIAKGEYLIPYAFPTLNPQSVQLRKSMDIGIEIGREVKND